MNQIPQYQILYPYINSQIQNQSLSNQYSQKIFPQNQISEISENNINPILNSNNNNINGQSKFYLFLK